MGGCATRAYNLAKGLLANGVNVTVIAGFPHYPTGNVPIEYRKKALVLEQLHDMKVIRTFIPPLASKGFTKRLLLFMSFIISSIFPLPLIGRIDGVFAAKPQILSIFPAVVYGMIYRCQIILNVDDLWPEALYDLGMLKSNIPRKVGEFIAKVAYSLAYAITPISQSYVEIIANKYGIRKSKLAVIPGGVDLSLFPPNISMINKVGLFKVLYIGGFSPAYNFEQVLKAARLLEGEEISIVLQGGGEMAPTIRDRIMELDLENIELVERIVSREEVAKILMGADALLLPLSGLENIEKGISSKLYEYQAAGKPIICCSRGMSGRYISDTGSGLIVEPGDYEGLARSILYLRDNPSSAESFGEKGRKYVENNMSIEKIGLKMMMIFKNHSRAPEQFIYSTTKGKVL